jgi:type I restriction enzyme, S subunit
LTVALPSGWRRVHVRDLARDDEQPVLTGPFGTNIGKGDFVSEGCPVLTIGCLTDAGINPGKAMFVKMSKAEELDRYRLREGDLLFSRMASVGRAGMVPRSLEGALFNYHIMRLRLSDALMLPELFMAYVRGAPEVHQYLEEVNHGATRDGINTTQLLDMPVSLPPLNEQRRMVAKLEALQARSRRAREALDAVPLLLEKLRQAILAAAFRGDLTADWRAQNPNPEPASALLARIRTERRKKWEESELAKLKAKGKTPTDDKWKTKYKEPEAVVARDLPELPPGWCWASVDELCPGDAAAVYGIILPGDDVPNGVPYVRPVDMRDDGTVDFDSLKRTSQEIAAQYERAQLRTGDVVLSIVGTIGKVIIVPSELEGGNITQSSARIRPPSSMSSLYLSLALRSPVLTRQYDAVRFGNAVQRLNVEHVRRLGIPLPPQAEQEEVTRRAERALATLPTTIVDEAAARLAQLESAVLAKAFRGELIPQDPNDEPAEVTLSRATTTSAEAPRQRGRRAKAAE